MVDDVIYIDPPTEIRCINDLDDYDFNIEEQARLDEPPIYRVAVHMPKPRCNNTMRLSAREQSMSGGSPCYQVISDRDHGRIVESQPVTSQDCIVSCDQTVETARRDTNSSQSDESPPPSYNEAMDI